VNLFSAGSWLWKALRGHSITFAALFALGALGLSIVRLLQNALGALGVPWLALLILPALIIGWIAKRELVWMPEVQERKKWARRLVFGSLAVSVLLALVFPKPEPPPGSALPPGASESSPRLRGPSGK
jgi:hypothetical protein